MPGRTRVTGGYASRSCECSELAVEETADGTGEGEIGVMCGRLTEPWRAVCGNEEVKGRGSSRSRRPREKEGDER